jgi:hypothetical protein
MVSHIKKIDTDESQSTEAANRTPLYEFKNPFESGLLKLSKTEIITCEKQAQSIVRSFMNLRVKPLAGHDGQNISLIVTEDASSLTSSQFRDWVQSVPSLLQKNLGGTFERNIYNPNLDVYVVPEINDFLGEHTSESFYSPHLILRWYPEIHDALEQHRSRCACGCEEVLGRSLRRGCLQSLIYSQILLLVGHAMAEAGGAESISHVEGSDSSKALMFTTSRLLGDVASGKIHWSEWFLLVATAITGTPRRNIDKNRKDSEILGFIAGPMTVIPAWLVLDKDYPIRGSWSVKTLMGIPSSVMTERAILLARPTNQAYVRTVPEVEICTTAFDHSDGNIKVESAVIGNQDEIHYLIMIISSSQALRCVSPVDVYLSKLRAKWPECPHQDSSPSSIRPWTMSSILQQWNRDERPVIAHDKSHAHVAFAGGSIVNRNIAMALAGGSCVVQTKKCCLSCLARVSLEKEQLAVAYGSSSSQTQVVVRSNGVFC